jgi:hypothetical protein
VVQGFRRPVTERARTREARGGDPSELQARLPQAVNLNTFPATFFVGRDGLVHGAHAGFAGKATGEEHARQTAEMRRKVEDLLAETGINR